jgi:hypothetical protein
MLSHQRNLIATRRDDFVARVNKQIKTSSIKLVRIHASGDFYDAERTGANPRSSDYYIKCWHKIAKANPGTTFYAYTRSWTIPVLRKALLAFAKLPNVQLWFSVDNSMPRPPRCPSVKLAWLAENDNDKPPYRVDLVFRDRAKTPMKKMDGAQVCPYEQKVPRKVTINCTNCKLCYKQAVPQPLVQLTSTKG